MVRHWRFGLFISVALTNVGDNNNGVSHRTVTLEGDSVFPSVENVLGVYETASKAAKSEGMEWYRNAHRFAKSLDVDISRSVGIIAALSPMSGWDNNMAKAAQFYRQNGLVCYGVDKKGKQTNGIGLSAGVIKAQEIWHGADPLDVLSGNKVRSFYANILNPDSEDVTVDRHAFDIAVGKKTDDKTRGILSRKGIYDSFAEVYIEAANSAGIVPNQMQAATWVAWRETHGIV